jgi:hypothetical protein
MAIPLIKFLSSFLLIVSLAHPAFAFLPATAFWRHRILNLKFTTAAQSVYASNCSGIVTVQNINAQGVATNRTSNLTVNLSGTGSVVFYSDSSCMTSTTSVTIPSGSNSASFYFIDTAAESITLTASASNYASIAQNATVSSNPFVWTGGAGAGNTSWSLGANWSGGSAPSTTSHVALFDGTCTSNCSPTIGSAINIGGIRLESGYSGTITQNAAITLSSTGWVQKSGSFVGGSANITINGHVTVTGGSFQSTSGTFTFSAPANFENFSITTPATFSHNSGILSLRNWNMNFTFPSGTVLNHLNLGNGFNGETHTLTGSPVINGTLTVNVPSNGAIIGSMTVKGDVVFTSCGASPNALLTLSGGAGVTQTISGAGSNYILPLVIDTAGSVVFNTTGTPTIAGPFTYTAGTVTWTNQNIGFIGSASSTVITSNGLQFPNVVFGNLNGATLQLTDTMTINGNISTVYLGCSSCKGIQGGAIILKGNLTSDQFWATSSTAGFPDISPPLTFAGTSAQIWKETAGNFYNNTVTIANSAGVTLTAASSIPGATAGSIFNLVLSSGDLNLAGGSLTATTLSLNGRTLTKSGGTLTVGGAAVGTGSLYGGTIAP